MESNRVTAGEAAEHSSENQKSLARWPKLARLRKRLAPSSLLLEARRAQHQVKLRYHWLTKPATKYQSFFVLAAPRTGSNMVVDFLNQLPNVQSQWEVLCRHMPEGPRKNSIPRHKAIKHIRYSLHLLQAPLRGCKFLLYQMAYCGLTPSELESAFPNTKFIVLYRQSLIEQYVSYQSAVATQEWVVFKGQQARQARVTVDTADLKRFCEEQREQYRHLFADPALASRSVTLSYEELTANPALCLQEKICPLLGAPYVEPKSNLRKQNPRPLSERVTNYSQIAGLAASPLCWHEYHTWSRPQRRAA